MWEDIAPVSNSTGLYDELAEDLVALRHSLSLGSALICRTDSCTNATFPVHIIFDSFVNMVILALRHDNPHFNEARFRRRLRRE